MIRIEFIFKDPELRLPSDTPVVANVLCDIK